MYDLLGEPAVILLVASVRERLTVGNQAAQKFDGEIFNI
jgi:hypothetical protein